MPISPVNSKLVMPTAELTTLATSWPQVPRAPQKHKILIEDAPSISNQFQDQQAGTDESHRTENQASECLVARQVAEGFLEECAHERCNCRNQKRGDTQQLRAVCRRVNRQKILHALANFALAEI